eukprot:scaffold277909_cov36-Tisochrysis_lutea.AAC.1
MPAMPSRHYSPLATTARTPSPSPSRTQAAHSSAHSRSHRTLARPFRWPLALTRSLDVEGQ